MQVSKARGYWRRFVGAWQKALSFSAGGPRSSARRFIAYLVFAPYAVCGAVVFTLHLLLVVLAFTSLAAVRLTRRVVAPVAGMLRGKLPRLSLDPLSWPSSLMPSHGDLSAALDHSGPEVDPHRASGDLWKIPLHSMPLGQPGQLDTPQYESISVVEGISASYRSAPLGSAVTQALAASVDIQVATVAASPLEILTNDYSLKSLDFFKEASSEQQTAYLPGLARTLSSLATLLNVEGARIGGGQLAIRVSRATSEKYPATEGQEVSRGNRSDVVLYTESYRTALLVDLPLGWFETMWLWSFSERDLSLSRDALTAAMTHSSRSDYLTRKRKEEADILTTIRLLGLDTVRRNVGPNLSDSPESESSATGGGSKKWEKMLSKIEADIFNSSLASANQVFPTKMFEEAKILDKMSKSLGNGTNRAVPHASPLELGKEAFLFLLWKKGWGLGDVTAAELAARGRPLWAEASLPYAARVSHPDYDAVEAALVHFILQMGLLLPRSTTAAATGLPAADAAFQPAGNHSPLALSTEPTLDSAPPGPVAPLPPSPALPASPAAESAAVTASDALVRSPTSRESQGEHQHHGRIPPWASALICVLAAANIGFFAMDRHQPLQTVAAHPAVVTVDPKMEKLIKDNEQFKKDTQKKIDSLSTQWHSVKEETGKLISNVKDIKGSLSSVRDAAKEIKDIVRDNDNQIKRIKGAGVELPAVPHGPSAQATSAAPEAPEARHNKKKTSTITPEDGSSSLTQAAEGDASIFEAAETSPASDLPTVPVSAASVLDGTSAEQLDTGAKALSASSSRGEAPFRLLSKSLTEMNHSVSRVVGEMTGLFTSLSSQMAIFATLPTSMPLEGRITSPYGRRDSPLKSGSEFHRGIDIGAPLGSPVYAPADGDVVFSGVKNGFGNCLLISHGKGQVVTAYGHLSKLLVRTGQRVTRGQVVAKVGSTGFSTGPHLHFEVRIDGQAVDPSIFVGKKGQKAGTLFARNPDRARP